MPFSLPLAALYRSGQFVACHSIQGIQKLNASKQCEHNAEHYRKEYALREFADA